MEAILAFDIGTTTCKAVVTDGKGQVLAQAVTPYGAGGPVDDPLKWWEACRHTIRLAARQSKGVDLAALAGCGKGTGLALLDHAGNVLPACWQELQAAAANEADAGTSRRVKLATWGRYLRALQRIDPQMARQVAHLCGVKDYVNYVLTGRLATDPANARNYRWPANPGVLGLKPGLLPRIRLPQTMLGTLKATAARQLGLPTGLPVVVGGHDGACSQLGAGMVGCGEGCLNLGTVGVVRINTTRPLLPTHKSRTFTYPFIDGLWASGGDLPTGGSAVIWFGRIAGLLPQRGPGDVGHAPRAASLSRLYEAVQSLASASPPGANGLLFLPYVHGAEVPRYDPAATGAFVGLRPSHTRADLARAVLEGVALGLRAILSEVERRGSGVSRLALTGGGGRSDAWARIMAGVFGMPLERRTEEVSALGAAMLGATALGWYPTVEDAARHMAPRSANPITADPAEVRIYEDVYMRFQAVVKHEWRS